MIKARKWKRWHGPKGKPHIVGLGEGSTLCGVKLTSDWYVTSVKLGACTRCENLLSYAFVEGTLLRRRLRVK